MSTLLQRVLGDLSSLSPSDRGRVVEKAKLLNSMASSQSTSTTQHAAPVQTDDLLLDALSEVVERRTGERVYPAMLRKSQQYAAFRDKTPPLMEFFEKHASRRNERRALVAVAFGVLYDDLARMNVSISARTLLSHAHRLPAVLDVAFPGYASSSLLGMVVGSTKDGY